MSELVPLKLIRLDGGTQPRAGLDQETLAEYVRAYNAGAVFPPIELVYDGQDYWPFDGFHRIEASRLCGAPHVNANVRQGTRRDAVLLSVGANATHGLRRSNADKRRAVETLLRDPEWAEWSNREIARRCAVDDKTVGTIRKELSAEIPQIDERKVVRGDSKYTMQLPQAGEANAEHGRIVFGKWYIADHDAKVVYDQPFDTQAEAMKSPLRLSKNGAAVPASALITKMTQAGTYPLVDAPVETKAADEKLTKRYRLDPDKWYPVDAVNLQIVLEAFSDKETAMSTWPMVAMQGEAMETFDSFKNCSPAFWKANFGARPGKHSRLALKDWYAVNRGERAVLGDAMYSWLAAREFIYQQLGEGWTVMGGVDVDHLGYFAAPDAEPKHGEWRVVDIHEARYWDAKTELSFEEWMAAQAADPESVERDEDYGLPKAAPMAAPDFPIEEADEDEDVEVGVNEAATARFSLPSLEATWDEIDKELANTLDGELLMIVRKFIFDKLQALDMEIGYEALR